VLEYSSYIAHPPPKNQKSSQNRKNVNVFATLLHSLTQDVHQECPQSRRPIQIDQYNVHNRTSLSEFDAYLLIV